MSDSFRLTETKEFCRVDFGYTLEFYGFAYVYEFIYSRWIRCSQWLN